MAPKTNDRPITVEQLPGEVKALLRHDDESSRGSWNNWSEHVLSELERLNSNYEKLRVDNSEQITQLRIDNASLQVKSGLWGIAGALSTIVLGAILYFSTEGLRPSGRLESQPVANQQTNMQSAHSTDRYVLVPGSTNQYLRVWQNP